MPVLNECIYCKNFSHNVISDTPCIENKQHRGYLTLFLNSNSSTWNCCGMENSLDTEFCSYGPHVFQRVRVQNSLNT